MLPARWAVWQPPHVPSSVLYLCVACTVGYACASCCVRSDSPCQELPAFYGSAARSTWPFVLRSVPIVVVRIVGGHWRVACRRARAESRRLGMGAQSRPYKNTTPVAPIGCTVTTTRRRRPTRRAISNAPCPKRRVMLSSGLPRRTSGTPGAAAARVALGMASRWWSRDLFPEAKPCQNHSQPQHAGEDWR